MEALVTNERKYFFLLITEVYFNNEHYFSIYRRARVVRSVSVRGRIRTANTTQQDRGRIGFKLDYTLMMSTLPEA